LDSLYIVTLEIVPPDGHVREKVVVRREPLMLEVYAEIALLLHVIALLAIGVS
jgi:hypothetical protein